MVIGTKLIVIHSLTPIIIAVLGLLSKAKIGKIFDDVRNMKDSIDNVKDEIVIIKEYLDADKDITDYRNKLNEMNTYYISAFNNQMFKDAASSKGNSYIQVIEHIISTYDMEIHDFNKIITELENGAKLVYKNMACILGEEITSKYYEIHLDDYNKFKEEIENILSDTKNHYMERFVNASTMFLRQFMRHLKELEKETCKSSKLR